MSESFGIDVSVADSISPEPRMLKRPTLQLALKQQAKRRRRNTSIATQGNVNGMPPIPRVIVKVLPPLPLNERNKVHEGTESETEEVQPITPRNASVSVPTQTTMREVLASIPGFKTTKRTTRNLSAAAQIQRAQEGCVDLQNPSSILAKANLRGILNKHTFGSLPPLYQHKLVQLLPEVDRCPDGSSKLSNTALSNEFFGRACQKWRDRLAAGEFTPESQQKIRAEAERDKGKLDPWKVKHFEPFWGTKGESSSQELSTRLPSSSKACSSAAPSKKKSTPSDVVDEDETPPKKRSMVGRKIGRRRMKRKKPIRKIVISTLLNSEDKTQITSEEATLVSEEICSKDVMSVESCEIAEMQPIEIIEIIEPVHPSTDTDEPESVSGVEFDSSNVEKEEVFASNPTEESDCEEQSSVQVTPSNDSIIEISNRLEEPSLTAPQPVEINIGQDKFDGEKWDGTKTLSAESNNQVGENANFEVQEMSTEVRASEEEDVLCLSNPPTIKDSLPSSDTDEEKESKEQDVDERQMEIDDSQALNEMKDFLSSSVGHFVQEDSSPEDFFQSHQVTEALELLRDIHDREESVPVIAEQQKISSPENVTTHKQDELDSAVAGRSSQEQQQMIEPSATDIQDSLLKMTSVAIPAQQPKDLLPKTTEVPLENRTDDSNRKSEPAILTGTTPTNVSTKPEILESSVPRVSTSEATPVVIETQSVAKIEAPVQQPTTVTLTLPFPVTLPLNLPLTLPISLPPGTTLVVSDPSTLVGIRTNTSHTTTEGKTISSITSLTPIAPNKPRVTASSSSPSRILPRSSQPVSASNPVPGTSSSGAGGLIAPRNGSGKQNQPSRAPPGTVNLERSYRICQAVIENSPNCEQLKAQLRPPSAFSSSVVVLPPCSPVTGSTNITGANRSSTNKSGSKNSLGAKPIKGGPVMKIASQQGIGDSKSVPQSIGTTSPSNIILVHPATANMGVVDQQSTIVNKVAAPSTAQLPRQQLICIAPNNSEVANHPLSKTPPANLAGNRTIGVSQQQLRPASTPPHPKPPMFASIPPQAQQSSVTVQSYQQQPQQQGVSVTQQVNYLPFNNWPQQQQQSQQQPRQQQGSTPKIIAPATVRTGTHSQSVFANLQQANSNTSFIQEQSVQQQMPLAPRIQQPINIRQRTVNTTQTHPYASSSVQVNLQPMQNQQQPMQTSTSQQQQGTRQPWPGPPLQNKKQINISGSSAVPALNPVATPQTPPFVQNDVQLVSMGMSMRAQVPGNGSSITPQLPIHSDPSNTGNSTDNTNDDAVEKASLSTDCDCQLKAMVMCQRCGAFCHDDCIGPTQLCFTCIVP
jgi:additional sex combs-like protein